MIIDQLPSVGTPALTDETVTEQGQNLFKVTWQRLLTLFKGNTALSELSNDAGFVNASGAAAAAPVQSVNGMTGAVTIPSASLSDDNPQPLGAATPGTSTNVSRADHVHAMPSADQVGAMSKWELLWTNASPTSAYGEQTVSLNLSGYQMIAIVLNRDTGGAAKSTTIVFVGSASKCVVYQDAYGLYPGSRNATVSTTGVAFSNGYDNGNSTAAGTSNSVAIPYQIFGIRGVNS